MSAEMVAYMVAWTYQNRRHLIDCDSQRLAGLIAALMSEAGRSDVTVMEVPYEEDAEMKARIWARVQARIQEMPRVFA